MFLSPLSAIYGAVIRTRLAFYRKGIIKSYSISVPVISVGNITTGGTGKTPMVAWLARRLAEKEHRVCILTRGYGRHDPGRQVVVSDGQSVLANVATGGDEPRLLAEQLLGVAAVISNRDRISAAKWAIENLKSTVFILDDGYQHLAVKRDLNIVTIDSMKPWGGQRLLPRGHLREPIEGLSRADVIVLTRTERVSEIEALRNEVSRLSMERPVMLSRTHTTRLFRLATEVEVDQMPEEPVLAFCAIGNPESFFEHAAEDGHKLVTTERFRDHHIYTQNDVDSLTQKARTCGAHAMLTTAKDAVKLRGLRFDLPCYVLEIDMTFDDEKSLLEMVYKAIRNTPSNPGE